MPTPWALAIHGGAGLISRDKLSEADEIAARQGLQDALDAGRTVLEHGGSALDAVQEAIVVMESCPVFNAGRGSVLNADGDAEMDAALMTSDRRAGAVAACRQTRHPIRLARAILDDGLHVFLAGHHADAYARRCGLEQVDPKHFHTEARLEQLERLRRAGVVALDHDDVTGTVGAVALDVRGRLAAGNSTGGMANKRPGRVGDSPVIGAGTWCDDRVAVAATGHGESFIRTRAAGAVSGRMHWAGQDLHAATEAVLADVAAIGGDGGLIAVDAGGTIALPFNSGGMYRGWATPDGSGLSIW